MSSRKLSIKIHFYANQKIARDLDRRIGTMVNRLFVDGRIKRANELQPDSVLELVTFALMLLDCSDDIIINSCVDQETSLFRNTYGLN